MCCYLAQGDFNSKEGTNLNVICHLRWFINTNLACDKLIIKIVQSSFIHKFVHFTNNYRAVHIITFHINHIS
jgi:hypothetical protein